MQRIVPVPQLRKLVAGQPSPATCLILKDARDYYANYNAAPRPPLLRSSPSAHVDHNARDPQPSFSPIIVVDKSPSPPPVTTQSSSDIGLQLQPAPLQPRAVWTRPHDSSQESGNITTDQRALSPEPKGNFANLPGPAPDTIDPDLPYDTDNVPHLSSCRTPSCEEPLPSFAEFEAEVDRYISEHTTALPSIANDQSGPSDGLLTPRNRQDAADRTTVDRFLPRTTNGEHANVTHSAIQSLHSDRLSQDAPPLTRYLDDHQDFARDSSIHYDSAAHTRGPSLMRPDRHQIQQSQSNVGDLTRSPPAKAHMDPRADRGRITDEQALEILQANPTIAEEFGRACAIRLQQYQQSLDNAYNRRLVEMEDYTREWRNRTKKLWQAVRAGRFDPADMSSQSAWQGPQGIAKSAQYQLPVIDTRVGQPLIFENGQAHINEPIASRLSSASAARTAPPVLVRTRRVVRPDPRQLQQNDNRSHPSGSSQSGRSRFHTQSRPVSSAVPEQLHASQLSPRQRTSGQVDTFQNASNRPTTPQPESSSGPACAETEAHQPVHCQPVSQSIPDESVLVETDPIPKVAVQAAQRQLLGREWISDLGGFAKESSGKYSSKSNRLLRILSSNSLGSSFTSSLNLSYSAILLGVKLISSEFDYRKFERLLATKNIADASEVVIELSEANVLMFGKAFCYLKERRDLLCSLLGLTRGRRLGNDEQSQRMYQFFCQQPTNKALNTMRHPEHNRLRFPTKSPAHETRKLLIARPKHEDGHITGARYFDVGSEQPTIRPRKGKRLPLQAIGN